MWYIEFSRWKVRNIDQSFALRLADAVTLDPDSGKEYFATPYEKKMPFNDFLNIMLGEESEYPHYASLQNSSLTTEYKDLVDDVDPHIPWFTEALGTYSMVDVGYFQTTVMVLMSSGS